MDVNGCGGDFRIMERKVDKLNLIKKEVVKKEDYGFGIIEERKEVRWFVETGDGFDGTAQGYGFKTPQAVYRAYAFFKNKDKYAQQKADIKRFLKENLDIKKELDDYFDESECLWRLKDGEEDSIEDMVERLEDGETKDKFKTNKHLWKQLLKYYHNK